jgi:CHAD domain-containing protein
MYSLNVSGARSPSGAGITFDESTVPIKAILVTESPTKLTKRVGACIGSADGESQRWDVPVLGNTASYEHSRRIRSHVKHTRYSLESLTGSYNAVTGKIAMVCKSVQTGTGALKDKEVLAK